MTRQPKARKIVLDAARRIVESRGAGHLTFEELALESGVTRGGITYHFPTKQALLKGLIQADIEAWDSASDSLESDCPCPKTSALAGQIRCNLDIENEGHKRFVSGLLSAAMVDPELLDPIREYQKQKFADWSWDDDDLRRCLLLLAAEGLFWQSFFDLSPMPPEARERMARLIESLVQQMRGDDEPF